MYALAKAEDGAWLTATISSFFFNGLYEQWVNA